MSRATQFLAVAFGARLQTVAPLDHVATKVPGAGGSQGGGEGVKGVVPEGSAQAPADHDRSSQA